MKIIIAGTGKVGSAIAGLLDGEGHDITLIDKNRETISHLSDQMDVKCLEGNATDSDVLIEAGAQEADLLVAATQKDEVNMICGISAKKLGAKHVVARIREPEYFDKFEFLRNVLGIDMIVNPEYECAKEISRILRSPGASRVYAFSKGSVEIAEYKLRKGGALDGVQIKDLLKRFGAKVLISVVERGDSAFIPNGSFTLAAGDRLSITGEIKELRKFYAATDMSKRPIKDVMIMGGGRISVYLAKMLAESGIGVTVIEKDRERCNVLCELVPEAKIIYGDASNSAVLNEEGINGADAFVALSGDDSDNIITSMYVSGCNVNKIITKVNRNIYSAILDASGLDSVVSPKEIVGQQLARYARALGNSEGSPMETLYKMADGKAEAMEFIVGSNDRFTGIPLQDLSIKEGTIIAAVIRGNKNIIPDGRTVLLTGDHAIVCAVAGSLGSLGEIIEAAE